MVTRLSALNELGPLGIRARYIEGYGGQFESPEEIAEAGTLAPAIFVAYDGETGEMNGDNYISHVGMTVFVLAESYNPEQLRLGGPNVPGLYQMIEAVRKALVNQTCGLDIDPLLLTSVTPLWRGGPQGLGFSLAALKFSTIAYTSYPPDPEIICEKPLMIINWELGPISLETQIRSENEEDIISGPEAGLEGS
jgi:phage gp37-like protein